MGKVRPETCERFCIKTSHTIQTQNLQKILPQNLPPKMYEDSRAKLNKAAPQKILHSSALKVMGKSKGEPRREPRQSATSIWRSKLRCRKNAIAAPPEASASRECPC